MCERQQSLMRKGLAQKEEGEGDAVSCSISTSIWSAPSSSSDCEDKAVSLTEKAPEVKSSDKWKGSKLSRRKKDKKCQETYRQVLKLPLINSCQISKPRIQSPTMNWIKELKSQVWDLQQQLSEAQTENKLLKRHLHRHTVALQHFQDPEGSISQILGKKNNESRVLRGLLHETRACRDHSVRQLQATENKLLNTKAALQHLQLLSQDDSLLKREELTLMLARATAQLEEKDRRILDLEKNLKLCQASFNRQLVTEKRKINEARKISCCLQEQIYKLTKEIQDRQRELVAHNIYSHRCLKRSTKKSKQA